MPHSKRSEFEEEKTNDFGKIESENHPLFCGFHIFVHIKFRDTKVGNKRYLLNQLNSLDEIELR